jgi:hypothetical protein
MTRSDGAGSGVLTLQAADELHFNCHITFTDERAATGNFPRTATEVGTLKFANEAYDAEMCSLLGATTQGAKLPTNPTSASGPLPAFATLE